MTLDEFSDLANRISLKNEGKVYAKLFTSKDCKGCIRAKKLIKEADINQERLELIDIGDGFGAKIAGFFAVKSVPALISYRVTTNGMQPLDSYDPQSADDIAKLKEFLT